MKKLQEAINIKRVETFTAQIYIGTKKGYDNDLSILMEDKKNFVKKICQNYVDKIGWCVSVTSTDFIYKDGQESGFIIGIINYPRFPLTKEQLKNRTINLASILKENLQQLRVSIVFSDETFMLS